MAVYMCHVFRRVMAKLLLTLLSDGGKWISLIMLVEAAPYYSPVNERYIREYICITRICIYQINLLIVH
jgi:hypothetical protein